MTSWLAAWLTRAATFWDSASGAAQFVFTFAGPSSFAGTVAISVMSEQAIASAPFQINLEANVTDYGVTAGATAADYDPQYHDIEYIWSVEKYVDDVLVPAYSTSTYSAPVDLLPAHKVKGTKFGKRICHVIGVDDVVAGESTTFRFTVTAINLATGESATSATLEKTVSHPDDLFSAAETFVVRKSSATNYPTTSNSVVTTIAAARSAATSAGLTKARICVERGQTYDEVVVPPTNSQLVGVVFDTWGTGDAEITGASNSGTVQAATDAGAAFVSFGFDGFKVPNRFRAFGRGDDAPANEIVITISNCSLPNIARGIETGGDIAMWFAVSNVSIEGFKEWTWKSSSSLTKSLSVIGGFIAHDEDQTSDNANLSLSAGGEGYSIRDDGGTELFYISQTQMFQRQGWYNNSPGIASVQPCIRTRLKAGLRAHFERCLFEGGTNVLTIGGDNNANSIVSNTLVERCMIVGGPDTVSGIGMSTCGTVRNNHFMFPPSRDLQGNFAPGRAVRMEYKSGASVDPRTLPVKFYNNTSIGLQDTGATTAGGIFTNGYSVVAANNVQHEPYATTPRDGGSFTFTEVYTPKYQGYKTAVDGLDPTYVITGSGDFTAGEVVTETSSGFQKTYVGTATRFNNSGMLAFEMSGLVTNSLDQEPGFQRFAGNSALTGNLGGTGTTGGAMYAGQSRDSAFYHMDTIARTITPTHVLAYDAQTGNFTEGDTLTGGTSSATGTICQVFDDGTTGLIWLRDVTGTFADNETITDEGSGSATANGAAASAGTGALWVPTSPTALASGTWAEKPYTRVGFAGDQTPTLTQGALVMGVA